MSTVGGRLSGRQELLALLLPGVVLVAAASVHATRRAFAAPVAGAGASGAALRVCADPNNLPFSNAAGAGFENKIAQLVGQELGRPVRYTWWAQRRGFVRNTLNAGACDLVVGIVSGMELLATTRPYYKSTYVFVTRRDRHLGIRSFEDPTLRRLKIGVQLIGDDFANTPPAHALANRGMTRNIVGYTVYGDYRKPNPPSRIIDAVARGDVDVAVVWGPLAGYFAKRSAVPLDVVPVEPQIDLPYLPFVFDIAMGVRRGDTTFKNQIDDIIERRQASIDSILAAYGVPRADAPSA
ncbi:MAG TPA: substrate-binding domain-containing protein [Gemmatimonadaceae bacterium]|nr:substrate-binding domain-containing protein [Gemmatimonadaceae bacterium]